MEPDILAFLRQQKTYTVGTMGPDHPWVATMYFADDGKALYSAIKGDAITLSHVASHPTVAFAVNGSAPDYFLQGLGTAEDLGFFEAFPEVRRLLEDKAPEIARFLNSVPKLHALRIQPTEFFTTDHRERISARLKTRA